MSLQIWLPFNGDLYNQGLTEISIVNNSTTINNNGKIGKCLHFSNTEYITMTPGFLPETGKEFSCCYWVKELSNNTVTNFRVVYECGQFIVGQYGNKFNVWQTNSGIDIAAVIDSTMWVHCCVTVDASGLCKIYINGQYQAQKTISTYPNSGTTTIGRRTINGTNVNNDFLINDFRIYNHCLSTKEVEEISKGLVLHYKLDNNGLGGNNLALHTHDLNVSASKNNLNMYIRGASTRQLRPDGFYESKGTASWHGLSFWANQLNLVPGTKITYSFYIYGNGSSRAFSFYPMMFNSAGTRDTSTGLPISVDGGPYTTVNSKAFANTTATAPEYHYVTFEWNQAVSDIITNGGSIELSIQVHGTWNSGDWACIFAPKIEIGEIPTPWCPHISELSFDNNIIYDTSGYNNNGSVVGNLSVNTNTAKYLCSSIFNGSTAIASGRGAMVKDAITVACWAYMDNWSSYNARLLSCTEGGGWNFEPSSGKMNFAMGTGASSNTYKNATSVTTLATLNTGWHHFVGTYDGFSTKIYIDGILESTNNAYTTKTPIYYNSANGIFVGAEAAGTTTTPAGNYFNGRLSDVRIYATVLTEAQIKELYNTSMTVDNKGNLYARELVEK